MHRKWPDFFKQEAEKIVKSCLDSGGSFQGRSKAALRAPYIVSLQIEIVNKLHSIGEELILPCAKDIVHHTLGEEAEQSLNHISLSNNLVHR